MSEADESLARLSRALDQTGDLIGRIRPEQAVLPTPCPAWDVRGLVNHVVYAVQLIARLDGAPGEQHDGDLIGENWVGAYQQAANELLAAWQRAGALERTVQSPLGELTPAWRLGQQLTELVVHGWDIARATGQPTDLDPELGQVALAWARENLLPQYRGEEGSGKAFGLEVPIAASAHCTTGSRHSLGVTPG